MDNQERDRGRTSRASSTSSLGREVRCACQFFQSDSLLPERRAMLGSRPSSRNANQPIVADSQGGADEDLATSDTRREHEYEPIGTPLVNPRTMTPVTPSAPVVRIIDTDVAPVADSDDSIDLGARFGPVLEDNDLVLPLDGRIEDSAMETRESAGGGDTSEELESPQQLQDRLEERFFNAATPCTESRTDGEVNTSQVDSSAMEELPLRRGARGLPQRLRSQAGKLRSRIKSIQRPNFSLSIARLRSKKSKSPGTAKSRGSSEATKRGASERRSPTSDRVKNSSSLEASKAPGATEKRSRMERIRSSLTIDRPRLSLPDRSKFHLPERPRFNMKRPNVRFPTLRKSKRGSSTEAKRSQEGGRSDGSTSGEATTRRKNIFDFSTYPRIFERRTREKAEYATSSPKESRAESLESSTLPRSTTRRIGTTPLGPRWSLKFTDIKFADEEDEAESRTLAERSAPWRRPSLEQPRLSLRPQESIEEPESLPWQEQERVEDIPCPEDEEEDADENEENAATAGDRVFKLTRHTSEESYEDEDPPRIDPRLYGDRAIRPEADSIEEDDAARLDREAYRAAFEALDPRHEKRAELRDPEDSADLGMTLEDEDIVSSGIDGDTRSDQEQQRSSGSSYDRRRRGIVGVPGIDDDSEEFLAAEEARVAHYLGRETRNVSENALAREILAVTPKSPPKRPERKRSLRERREASVEFGEIVAPVRPKRDNRRRSVEEYDDYEEERGENADEESLSESRHRIVYHAVLRDLGGAADEPLDDIVVVKPQRRKSRTSTTSRSLRRSESLARPIEETARIAEAAPSAPPRRRKRPRGEDPVRRFERVNGIASCNGHHSPTGIAGEPEIARTAAPRKPQRATSREALAKFDRVETPAPPPPPPPPVPPKRSSRSRGASLVPDDDGTSHGAESIPEFGYLQEEIPLDEDADSRLDYPGYAMIEKRERPPRPPPPRKRRDEKFATCPRPGKATPSRPHRAYSTLRPARPVTPGQVGNDDDDDATAYEELMDSDEENERRLLRSGPVVSKIQGRPLPAPPRPPRFRRERTAEELPDDDDGPKESSPGGTSEAFASTQTDPLPDDVVIEEEVTRAKLVVTPSRSGSQILVSTERVPSPTMTNFTLAGSYSQDASCHERVPDPAGTSGYPRSEDFTSVPPERSSSQRALRRARRTPSPVRRSTAPIVPPLPASKSLYCENDYETSSREIVLQRDPPHDEDAEARLRDAPNERLGLEEELDRARNLRAAILANEPLKIGSLEVSDLRVDRLNVNTLETQRLTASEIEALVVSASEITSKAETRSAEAEPNILRELAAIRSRLELVNAGRETPGGREEPVRDAESERERTGEYTGVREHLQLDRVSRTTETRAIFSSVGSSRESSPTGGPTDGASRRQESSAKNETPEVLSRSSSPSRTGSPTGRRQTASPVKSLPPVISVTPDTPEPVRSLAESSDSGVPQRAVLSYVQEEETLPSSPPPPLPVAALASDTRFVAFPTSRIPPEFFGLASSPTSASSASVEPGVVELGQQLARALRIASRRAMRHFVGYIVNRIGHEDTDTKTREVELALCALLLIIAGLLIACFGGPRTVTHHHHWDYFNPPRL